MLRDEDIQMDIGRCVGGDFLRVTHIPTGVSRYKGPLGGANQHELVQGWLSEIEGELIERGLTQHLVPTYQTKNSHQFKR